MITSKDVLAWLEKLLAQPPVEVTATGGGGLPAAHSLKFEAAVLADRGDVDDAVRVLRRDLDPYNAMAEAHYLTGTDG